METATVTFPDGRTATVSGPTREAVMARIEAIRNPEPSISEPVQNLNAQSLNAETAEGPPRTELNPIESGIRSVGRVATSLGTKAAAGLTGIATAVRGGPGGLTPGSINRSAEAVRDVEAAGDRLFAAESPQQIEADTRLSEGIESVAKPVKTVLSAVPFAIGGSEEREEFMDVPLGDYLGELAQDNGASPLVATFAEISPDLAALAVGAGGASKIKSAINKPKLPTVEGLRTEYKSLLKVVDDSGVAITNDAFETAAIKMIEEMSQKGVRSKLTPKTQSSLDEIVKEVESGNPLTLKKAEEIRRIIKQGQKSIEGSDAATSTILLQKWDKFIETVAPKNLSGPAGVAPDEIRQFIKSARGIWTRVKKTETVESAIDAAQLTAKRNFSASGLENALRSEFAKIARKKGFKKLWTAEEQQFIRAVAEGTNFRNAMRLLGKAAPTGIVSGGIGAGVGFQIAGPAGAIAVPTVGILGRLAARRGTKKAAIAAREAAVRGPKK